jgi:predicted kinase
LVSGVGSVRTALVVLRGNSGSGKSTVARELQDRHLRELAVVSQDVLRREVLRVRDHPENPAVDLIDLVARFALDRGMHVVIEGILYADVYGSMLRTLAADHRGTTTFFRFDLSFDETLRRHDIKGCRDFGELELRQWWRDDDALPGCEEQIIGADQDVGEIADLIATAMQR